MCKWYRKYETDSKNFKLVIKQKKSNVTKEKGERGKEKHQEVKFSDLQSPSIFIYLFISYTGINKHISHFLKVLHIFWYFSVGDTFTAFFFLFLFFFFYFGLEKQVFLSLVTAQYVLCLSTEFISPINFSSLVNSCNLSLWVLFSRPLVILIAVHWTFSNWSASFLKYKSVRLMEFGFMLLHNWCSVLWAYFTNAITLYYTIHNNMKCFPKKFTFLFCLYGESSALCLEIIYNYHKQWPFIKQ